mmetsp:Transcript_23947/g.37523  ORF Transcript_23947/g.37523 Transcript_23947/m.37523 type:complete len:119 (+) Transcript_23947:435-791(+)
MRGLFFALLLPRLVLLLGLAAGTQAFIAGQPLALRGMRTVPQTTCGPSTTYMSLKSSDDPHSGPVGMAKELWIRLESFMVSWILRCLGSKTYMQVDGSASVVRTTRWGSGPAAYPADG